MSRTFDYQRGTREDVLLTGEDLQAGTNNGRTHSLENGTCGCPACSGQFQQLIEDDSVVFVRPAQEASVDGQGGTIRGKPVFTIEEAAYYLNRGDDGLIGADGKVITNSGAEWFGGKGPAINDYYDTARSKADSDGSLDTLTFGFYESQATLPEPYVFRNTTGALQIGFGVARGFSPLNEAQRAATREAIASWDDLIAVTFKETPFQQGDINFMNTTSGPAQASAYLPYDYGVSTTKNFEGKGVSFAEISGDVYIKTPFGPGANTSNGLLDEGQYGLTTLIHEIGHSLGMEHPGNYNFGPGFAVTYDNGAEYYQDSNQYSIMSYWDAEETNAARIDWELLTYKYPSTPMVHDVAAIQRVYGADMTTRTGDSTYGFNISADIVGRDSYDFRLTPAPVMTIWDAGGVDTIDVSGFNTPSLINLNPGSYSSAGGFFTQEIPTLAEINARRAAAGLAPRTQATYDVYLSLVRDSFNKGLFTDNIGIAYGVVIENAVGGAGNDTLIGNDVANVLNGGAGFDTVSYIGAAEGMTFNASTRTGSGAAAAGDTYISIEAFEGTNFADVFTGGNEADTLGGAGGGDRITGGRGADTLFGGAGDDRLEGGNDNDTLNGDAGVDILIGGNGGDTLNGGDGDDNLEGGNDADTLDGGAGNDALSGGNVEDYLNGGAGDDTLSGGAGNDVFLFTEVGGRDTITDFRRGQDRIDLSALDADANAAGVNRFTFVGSDAFSGKGAAGQLRAAFEGGVNVLQGDTDGDGLADFTIVTGSVLIGQSDIIFGG